MTDAPNTHAQVSETPPSFLRAYWEGAKDYTRMGRDFWRFVVALSFFVTVQTIFRISVVSSNVEVGAVSSENLIDGFSVLAVVLIGSVSDWLGLRRTLLILGGFLLVVLASGSAAWLTMGEAVPGIVWIVFFALLALASKGAIIAQYRGLRRFTATRNRVHGIMWLEFVSSLFFLLGIAAVTMLVYAQERTWRDTNSFPEALLLTLCFVLIGTFIAWKWITSEYQAGTDKTGSDLRPSGPFSGLVDVLKAPSTWRAVTLWVLCMLLTVPLFLGGWKLFPLNEHRDSIDGSMSLPRLAVHAELIYLFVVLPLLPLVGRISLPTTIKATAIGLSLAALLFSLPLGGMPLEAATLTGAVLANVASLFLWFRFLEYALNGAPLGREGSLASVLGIVWLLHPLLKYVLPKLFESQHKAPWTQVLPDLINPAASSVHSLWLIVLGIVLLATALLFALRRYLFGEESGQGQPCE